MSRANEIKTAADRGPVAARSGRGAVNPARRKRTYSRPSILDEVRLADGRLAWPVARDAGMSEATFRSRLKRGLSADAATFGLVLEPSEAASNAGRAPRRNAGRPSVVAALTLPDGRSAVAAAALVGVSPEMLRLRLWRGWSLERAVTQEARGWPVGASSSRRAGRV